MHVEKFGDRERISRAGAEERLRGFGILRRKQRPHRLETGGCKSSLLAFISLVNCLKSRYGQDSC